MLELLLRQYADQFGEEFPLADFAGMSEIDLINLLYECTLQNRPYRSENPVQVSHRICDAPGMKA